MVHRIVARRVALAGALLLLIPASALAQNPGRQAQAAARGPRAQPQRPALPPIGRGMNAIQLQQHLDALALTQAREHLKLDDEQFGAFAPKLLRLQTVRRRMMQERRRTMVELNQLLSAQTPSDDAIATKVRAFDDTNRRGAEELVKAFQELDGVLSPWQRGRFRVLEEQMERRKLELLTKLGPPNDGK